MSKNITVKQNDSPIYNILIRDSFSELENEIQALNYKDRRFCIVTDNNVSKLYLDEIEKILRSSAKFVCSFCFPAGEESKSLDTVKELYTLLIKEGFDRKDVLIALGGGVTGDLTGYTAATFMRGIDFIQIPTSLLAQVDSSIGGKTGVDFGNYKNMVGAFWQPKLVYINTKTLDTLELRQYYAGLAEVIKYGLVMKLDFYIWMLENIAEIYIHEPDIMEEMIYQSCLCKQEIVEKDPLEHGRRALLNFGHTVGHAIEKKENFRLLHGECVSLGMLAAAYISWKREYIDTEEFFELRDMLVGFRLPIALDEVDADEVYDITKSDKKMDAGMIQFILLKSIGHAFIAKDVSEEEIKSAILYLQYDQE